MGWRQSVSTCGLELIDDLHLVLVPLLLGGGERLFEDVDLGPEDYECVEQISSPSAIHVRLARLIPTSQ